VNRATPGNGSFIALDSIDHSFFRAASPEASYRLFKPAPGAPAGEFNPVILETLHRWLDETAWRAEKPPATIPTPRDRDRFSGLDAYIRAAMEKWEVPGLAIAVVKDDEVVLARGYGVCELGTDRKVTPTPCFRWRPAPSRSWPRPWVCWSRKGSCAGMIRSHDTFRASSCPAAT